MCQLLCDSELKLYPSNINEHLASFLFPFPQCSRDDVIFIRGASDFSYLTLDVDILMDLFENLPQKKDILDRCLLLCPSIYHLCRGIVPKVISVEYTAYLSMSPQSPQMTAPTPYSSIVLHQPVVNISVTAQIPHPPQHGTPSVPISSLSAPSPIPPPPPAQLCAPIIFPPAPKHLLSSYDDEEFQKLKTDIRSVFFFNRHSLLNLVVVLSLERPKPITSTFLNCYR